MGLFLVNSYHDRSLRERQEEKEKEEKEELKLPAVQCSVLWPVSMVTLRTGGNEPVPRGAALPAGSKGSSLQNYADRSRITSLMCALAWQITTDTLCKGIAFPRPPTALEVSMEGSSGRASVVAGGEVGVNSRSPPVQERRTCGELLKMEAVRVRHWKLKWHCTVPVNSVMAFRGWKLKTGGLTIQLKCKKTKSKHLQGFVVCRLSEAFGWGDARGAEHGLLSGS
ncbi:hypothetical protein Anapl_07971 [Anas platyrhynchos]|uniref:Uncharacterized protein n=1 Tax=Anas platyrhynchos TaxID=8839 RepID=R0KWW9_ANAPL|nr:hypothetical protein Anapl_07971 [Anas platyrhynchos]